MVKVKFEYDADFGPVINQMRLLMAQTNLLNQTVQNFDKQASSLKFSIGDSLASDIGKMGGWNTKVMELSNSVEQFGKSLSKQELSLKQYAKEGLNAFTSASNTHKLAIREVAKEMSQLAIIGEKNGKQLGMMITPQNINLKDFNTNLAVSRKQFEIFNTLIQDGTTKLINFGKNTQWAGRQITVGLTVPLTAWGNQVSKIFQEVNTELTRFQKVYGTGLMSAGDAETIKMTENVKQLGIEFSRTMGIAVKDTAQLAADLAATGQEGQKLLNSIRETTRLATLGDINRQDAMKTTLSLQNAFKTSTDELAHSVDFLNAVENQTSLSLQDLTTAIPKAGPVIKALGGDVKDLSLLMVALKEGGISAAEAANAIKSGMASLINPTKRASDVAKQYGIDVKAIVQANRGELMPTIIAFQQQLELLDDFGKAQVIENIFGKYQFARISALFDNLNASSSQTIQVMGLMGKSQKELAANSYIEMDTLMNSGAKRFQRATESIRAQFIDIGGSITTAITPIIEGVSSKIGKIIKFFEKLPGPVKSFIKVATGLAAIAGPIIMIAGVFSNFLGYVAKGAMSIVNLGRRMSGIPVEKFKMLDDTQLMAMKSTDALSQAFDLQKTSVEKLNAVLAVYKKTLGEAITLNPGFLNRQVASATTTGSPPRPGFQTGGSAWVPGSGDGDRIPAMLEPGEYVVNRKAAQKHSGLLDQINYQSAPRFQTGGRVNNYADKSLPPDLTSLLQSWQSSTTYIREDPERLKSFMSYFQPSIKEMLLRRKTSLGLPGEMSNTDQLSILQALQSGDFLSLAGRKLKLDSSPQSYTEHGLDWLVGKQFSNPLSGRGYVQERLLREQKAMEALDYVLEMRIKQPNNPFITDDLQRRIGVSSAEQVTEDSIHRYRRKLQETIDATKRQLQSQLPMGVEPQEVLIQRLFGKGTSMLPVSEMAQSTKYMDETLREKEIATATSSAILDSVSQMWAPPSSFKGGQKAYDEQKHWFPYVLNFKQSGGKVQSAEVGWTQKEIKKAYSQYTDTKSQSRFLKGFGRGRSDKNIPYPDDSIWRDNPLNTALHILLPNAAGRSEEEKAQLNILRRYMSMFNITDPSQLSPGMQAALMEMFMVHGGNPMFAVDPSLVVPFEKQGGYGVQVEGPGTYFTANLKSHDEWWRDYAGDSQYTISKTREAFRKVARSKGYLNPFDPDIESTGASKELRALLDSFSRSKAGREAKNKKGWRRFDKNHWLRDPTGAAEDSSIESPFYQYLIKKGYQGIDWGPGVITAFNIGRKGIGLSPISHPEKYDYFDSETQDFIDLEKPLEELIPNFSKVGYATGGKVQSAAGGWNTAFEQNDPIAQAYKQWVGGDWTKIRQNPELMAQMLSGMSSLPSGMSMMRATHLNSGVSPELGRGQAAAIQKAIAAGDYASLVGMPINWKGIASFSPTADKLTGPRGFLGIDRFHNFFPPEKQGHLGSLAAFFEFITGKNAVGRDVSSGKFPLGQTLLSEILTNQLSGTISGVSSDLKTRKPIIHVNGFSNGGKIQSAAGGLGQSVMNAAVINPAAFISMLNYLQDHPEALKMFFGGVGVTGAGIAGYGAVKGIGNFFENRKASAYREPECGDSGGIAKNGMPCRNMVSRLGERCFVHKSQPMTEQNLLDLQKIKTDNSGRVKYATGGTVQSAAGGYVFAHIVPGKDMGSNINLKYPVGLDILRSTNSALNNNNALVNKQSLINEFKKPNSTETMTKLFKSFSKLHPESDIKPGFEQIIKQSAIKGLEDAPRMINDNILYAESLKESPIKKAFNAFKRYEYLSDYRANVSIKTLMDAGFKQDGDIFTSPDGKIKVRAINKNGRIKFVDPDNKKINMLGPTSQTQRSLGNKPLINYLLGRMQSGGRVNNFAEDPYEGYKKLAWKKKASAPKPYEGIANTLPEWTTKEAERQAILQALQSAGVPNAENLTRIYLKNVLAHMIPRSQNTGDIYTNLWEATNLLKDSQLYNLFLEKLKERKDVQSRGGITAPQVVDGVMQLTGLSRKDATEALQSMAQGLHPSTRSMATAMMGLALLFPSSARRPDQEGFGMPIAVAAGLKARLQGDFYETIGERALPNLPIVKVVSFKNEDGGTPQSRKAGLLPGTPTRPRVIFPSRAGGGSGRISGTGATGGVSPDGQILSSTIDDMLVTSVTGHPLAVSSRELLAVTPDGLIAGVTSPGDESRKRIVNPPGTTLVRGKNFNPQSRVNNFADSSVVVPDEPTPADVSGFTEPVYMGNISEASMGKFARAMSMMATSGFQMKFVLDQFTSDVQNGRQKWIAGIAAGVQGLKIFSESGMGPLGKTLQQKGKVLERASDIYGTGIRGTLSGIAGKGMSMAGSGMTKLASALSNPIVSMGIDLAIAGIQKGIEIYNAEMEKARQAGKAAFAEPTETAKLMGIQLKSTTEAVEKFSKVAQNISGKDQGLGAYNKAFEKTVQADFGPLISTLKTTMSLQEKNNQLVNVYSNLIQRGMDPKNAKEITAEIARQGQALDAFLNINNRLNTIKSPADAMAQEVVTMNQQIAILNERANKFGVKAQWNGQTAKELQESRIMNEKVMFEAIGATGNSFMDKLKRGFFGTRGIGGYIGTGALFTSLFAPMLIDSKTKTQIASQMGATLKSAFALAASEPTASVEAINLIIAQFKNADTGKLSEEIQNILKEQGFGEGSALFDFFGKDGGFFNLDVKSQKVALAAVGAGMGEELTNSILAGTIKADLNGKLGEEWAKRATLVKVETEVDLQIEDTEKQLNKLKDSVQKVFDIAIQAKQAELETEDKRHEKALQNLDLEAERINKKKGILQENTDYYLKQLQKEKEAEDFYARQRQTGLSGLKAIASGDVFGFIGAQMEAASAADQYGRDLSMQNIQDTADAEQKKLDDSLKAIDERKQAEDARHQAEMDNINGEIELLRKKESQSIDQINTAIDLLEKAKGMSPGDAGWEKAITKAQSAADKAQATATSAGSALTISTLDPAITKSFNSAKAEFNGAVAIMSGDTVDAVDRLNASDIIATNIFKSIDIDPATSKAYQDVFSLLHKPPAPGVAEAVAAYAYAISSNGVGLPAVNVVNGQTGDQSPPTPATNGPQNSNVGWDKDGNQYYYKDGKWINLLTEKPKTGGGDMYKLNPKSTTMIKPSKWADGGHILGPGTSTSDSIPAMLSNGEFVMKADAVKSYGLEFMNMLNSGQIPKFSFGGWVGNLFNSAKNQVTSVVDNVKKVTKYAIRNPKAFIGDAWTTAKNVGGKALQVTKNIGSFVANNFLGVDDLKSMYGHFKKGEWGAGFKSLGAAALELGTTALMFVPGAGQVAMLGKFAQLGKVGLIGSRAARAAGYLSKVSDAKSGISAIGATTELIDDLFKLKKATSVIKSKNILGVNSLLSSEKAQKVATVTKGAVKAGAEESVNISNALELYDLGQSSYNIATGEAEEEDYKNVGNYAGQHYLKKLFPWMKITKLVNGGPIYGAGTSRSDSIPAMLSNGEYVVNAASVAKYGVPFMNALNAGKYANGGGVGVMPRTSVPSSPTYSVPSTPSLSPSNIASIAQYNAGGYAEGNTNSSTYHFNFNGAGMDMVMGHVNKAIGGTISNNSRGVYG